MTCLLRLLQTLNLQPMKILLPAEMTMKMKKKKMKKKKMKKKEMNTFFTSTDFPHRKQSTSKHLRGTDAGVAQGQENSRFTYPTNNPTLTDFLTEHRCRNFC